MQEMLDLNWDKEMCVGKGNGRGIPHKSDQLYRGKKKRMHTAQCQESAKHYHKLKGKKYYGLEKDKGII